VKAPKVNFKRVSVPSIKAGTVSTPKVGQLRGSGQNAGGLPNDLKKLFPKSSTAKPKW
jgi:hypothetical protein